MPPARAAALEEEPAGQQVGSYETATVGYGVEVRPSDIPGAGNGLWTTRAFERNQLITEYEGDLIDRQQALLMRRKRADTHVRALNSQFVYIAGLRSPQLGRGGGSFANDARDARLNNAAFVQRFDRKLGRDRVFLQAKLELPAGTEVFVSYGLTYWNHAQQVKRSPTAQRHSPRTQQPAAAPASPARRRSERQQQRRQRQQQRLAGPAAASGLRGWGSLDSTSSSFVSTRSGSSGSTDSSGGSSMVTRRMRQLQSPGRQLQFWQQPAAAAASNAVLAVRARR